LLLREKTNKNYFSLIYLLVVLKCQEENKRENRGKRKFGDDSSAQKEEENSCAESDFS